MNKETNNTLFIGKVAFHLSRVDSTNLYAHELISKTNPIEGTVIRTDEQNAGRGQFGSVWKSSIGENITLSIIFCPKFLLAKQQFYLNAAIALGVYDFINKIIGPDAEVSIKWPNDIYIGSKKVAGILIENILKGIYLDKTIVGIGINVNQTIFDPQLPNPISLSLFAEKKFDLNKIIFQLYESLEHHYLRLQKGSYIDLHTEYISRLFRLGVKSTFRLSSANHIEGVIIGTDEQGRLKIKVENDIKYFDLKEVSPVI